MKKIYFGLILIFLVCLTRNSFAQTTTYNYASTGYSYTVPASVTQVTVDMAGGQGGQSYYTNTAGYGGRVQCYLNVTPGEVLLVFVASAGHNETGSGTAVCPGNGSGYIGGPSTSTSGAGGGCSEIQVPPYGASYRTIVAGGGGGGGYDCTNDKGGAGGGTTGGSGLACGIFNSCYSPTGGTQTSGGLAPGCVSGNPTYMGSFGNGGAGTGGVDWAGGGGAGWYGGGGAYSDGGGGGGGSSYTNPALVPATSVIHTPGYNGTTNGPSSASNNGYVKITAPCTPPTGGTIVGNAPVCSGGTLSLTDPTGTTGGTWSSSSATVASIGATTGTVTGVSTTGGTATITYTGSACGTTATTTVVVTVNAIPTISGGTTGFCPGATTTLSASASGGAWSTTSSLATVVGTTGVVTGVSAGNPVISYTASGTGCTPATKTVTVNAGPAAISPSSATICPGITANLTDGTTGGTWSSSSSAATVNSSGIVTAVSGGTATISYTSTTTGCAATAVVSVVPVTPILGIASMCSGNTATLSDATTGGTWSSTNTAVATIGSTGIVTGVSNGSTTISYALGSTGCAAVLPFNITTTPSATFSPMLPGAAAFCAGGTGVSIGMSSSQSGVSYQVMNGTTPVNAAVTSFGFGFTFPFSLAPSTTTTYTIVGNYGSACATTMPGSVTVTVNPLPTVGTVGGGGSYCAGGTGVHVTLSASTIGVNYQLFANSAPVGSVTPGTGVGLDFGLQTTTGVYTVTALNATTGCFNNMAGSVTVTTNPLPATTGTFTNTGVGGGYCTGGSGVAIGLSGTTSGISYQLYLSGSAIGSPVTGSGGTISFGSAFTSAGSFTIIATNPSTGCSSTLLTTTSVTVNPLPTIYTVTGGGNYCTGGTGVHIGLSSSAVGINYTLVLGASTVSGTVSGTSAALDFGLKTSAGSYTITAANPTTGCSVSMFGSADIIINPLPTPFTVTSTATSYCAGGAGVHVGLSGSSTGTTYYLLNGATTIGSAIGTSGALDFGLQTMAGIYQVTATNTTTGCVGPMTSSVNVVINPLPVSTYSVTGTGAYCNTATATGLPVGLSGSQTGTSYQLFSAGATVGAPVTGGGSTVTFGSKTAGAYTVVATVTATGCTSNMTGSAAITANPIPTSYTITGGGGYCSGTTGVHIGLAATDVGINYQLFNGAALGSPVSGIGGAIDFGLFTATGTYTIVGTSVANSCTNAMGTGVVVSINPLPALHILTGGGNYCSGTGGVSVGLDSSVTGFNYQLFNGATAASSLLPGTTGSPISFGTVPAGVYTATATNAVTGCSRTMTGSATVTSVALPTSFTVTGTNHYCAGSGLPVGLSGSFPTVKYQLYNSGGTVGAPIRGTGSALSFGVQTVSDIYTVVGKDTATLCSSNMAGSAVLTADSVPTMYVITGGGAYCAGGTGVPVGLMSSSSGINYQLYNSGTAVGLLMPGTGSALNFGLQTAPGTYTIMGTNASTPTHCTSTMTGTAPVVASTTPTTHHVTGGGNYCPGTAGAVVGLDGSNSSTSYQLYVGGIATGPLVTGSGTSITFGPQPTLGVYTVVANNGCTGAMTGSVTVGNYTLPSSFSVTGGGDYCPSGTGVHVGLANSVVGVTYRVYAGGTGGTTMAGTGYPIDFGLQTTAGSYIVVATSPATAGGCILTMSGSATVGISALPNTHMVTGGGNYCPGGSGVHIGLNGSDAGTNYQLQNGGTITGPTMAGTGSALDFGLETAAGTYTIIATSTATGCSNTMSGSVPVAISALPTAYTVTGGGNYCVGGTGSDVSLSGSHAGVNYQLYNGTAMVGGPMAGTGSAIDFGLQAAVGTYMVIATTSSSSCSGNMTGAVTIGVNPAPPAYPVTGGGNFCAGGSGSDVSLSASNSGYMYQLLNSGAPAGSPMTGTGFGLDFGMQTSAGSYTVVATNPVTGCTGNMAGSAMVTVTPAPIVYTVAGLGSNYCAGGPGIDVTMSGSELGTSYQLYNGGAAMGSPVMGTGSAVDFGDLTGGGTYTVSAVNTTTGCSSNMGGSAVIMVSPLPPAYTVTGGGSYCNGGAGVHIGLAGSNAGVTYQLFSSGAPVGAPVTGSGAAFNFASVTDPGSYTVIATNISSACTNNMSGVANVIVDPLPATFTVTGSGSYCNGGTGLPIGLNGSTPGVNYQVYMSGSPVGSAMAGTGFSLNFGLETVAGTYSVIATNSSTTCSSHMAGSAAIIVNPAPNPFAVTGGGNYCMGGAGVHVGISGSNTGVSYQLFNSGSTASSSVPGTGSGLDFGLQTAGGTYTVVATNSVTGCSGNMPGGVIVVLNALPNVYTVIGGGNYCAGGAGVHVGLNHSSAGISYQLYNGVTLTGTPVIGSGGPLDFGPQTAAGTYRVIASDPTSGCSQNMSGTATVSENALVTPVVTISTGAGDTVCAGTTVTFTAMATNGGTPTFQWSVNGSVTGSSGNTFSYLPANGDVVTVIMSSSATCATPASVSSYITLTVNTTEMPTISIYASPGNVVCQGTNVDFTATSTYGGASPTYSWIVNSANMGSGTGFNYIPMNGDIVYCTMGSDYRCRLSDLVTSNYYHMEVDPSISPAVTVTANPGANIYTGENVTFTATVTNGGTNPTYQWYVNGNPVMGADMPTFSANNLSDGDVVECLVTSSGGCAGLQGNNMITMHVTSNVGVKQVASVSGDVQLVPNPNKGVFTVKGTLGTTADQEVTLEVTDLLGQVIYTGKVQVHNGEINEKIQLGNSVANGMYILNLSSATENKVFHMVIEQ